MTFTLISCRSTSQLNHDDDDDDDDYYYYYYSIDIYKDGIE